MELAIIDQIWQVAAFQVSKLVKTASPSLALMALWLLGGVVPAVAQKPLQYHGGPVLSTFTIYPLYYGNWRAPDITAQESYLNNLAAYLSGQSAPAGLQPMMKQYGVNQVNVAPYHVSGLLTVPNKPDPGFTGPDPCSASTCLWRGDVEYIIRVNQSAGRLPAYSSETLIVVFPAPGIGLHSCNGCGHHTSDSAVAPISQPPEDAIEFSYNPNRAGTFTRRDNEQPIASAPCCWFIGRSAFGCLEDGNSGG